jgi:hypothetical protein
LQNRDLFRLKDLADPFLDPDPIQTPLFTFENTLEAVYHNAIVPEQFNFNVHAAISAQKNSQVMFCSEFKHPDKLHELLKDHPR